MPDCKKFLIEKYGFTDDEADSVVKEAAALGNSAGPERSSIKAKRAAKQISDEAAAAAVKERQNGILRAKAGAGRREFIDSFSSKAHGLEAAMVGTTPNAGKGSRLSTESYRISTSHTALAAMTTDLERIAGRRIPKLAGDEAFNLDLTREMWNGADGSTGNTMAKEMAAILMRHKDALVERANAAGAFIKHLPGHVFAQTHDPRMLANAAGRYKTAAANQQAWIDFIYPLLDAEKTFRGAPVEKHADILKDIYYNIVTGTKATKGQSAGNFNNQSLAARLSQDRVLHFRDADSFFQYNQRFGRQTALQAIFSNVDRLARDTALMEQWGPNPDDLFERVLRQNERDIRIDDTFRGLETGWGIADPIERLRAEWEHMTGAAAVPVRHNLSHLMQGWRNWQNLTKMGGVTITSFADVVTVAARAKQNGVGFFERWNDVLSSFVPDTPAKKAALEDLGFGVDAMISDISGRLSSVDGAPGILSDWSNKMFKYNFLRWWTDRLDSGVAWAHSKRLARALGGAWGDVDEGFRATLRDFDITEKDWDGLRAAIRPVGDGISVVSPSHIANADLRMKYHTFIQGEVDSSVLKPGAREKAIALGRSRPGTAGGEFLRLIWQYKMFSLTTVTKLLPLITRDGVPAAIPFALAMGLAGYASGAIKDMLLGRMPAIPEDPAQGARIAANALLRGGGLGILGDILLKDYGKYGQSFGETLLGPAIGQANTALNILSDITKGDMSNPEAFRFAMSNVPFANLFYVKGALDNLATYSILESMNPGYIRRTEQRLKDEGSGFMIQPRR